LFFDRIQKGRSRFSGLPLNSNEIPLIYFFFFDFCFAAVFLEDEQGVPFGLQDIYVTPPFMFIYNQNYHRKKYLSNKLKHWKKTGRHAEKPRQSDKNLL
jgi:hypothetical protein